MRIEQLTEASRASKDMHIDHRHEWLKFMLKWFSGEYMNKKTPIPERMFLEFVKLFPPAVRKPKRLYRLVTIPEKYKKQKSFHIKASPGKNVSSWSGSLSGIQAVHDIAINQRQGARILITAIFPSENILLTPASARRAVKILAHDFYERYPLIIDDKNQEYAKNWKREVRGATTDYPGTSKDFYDIYEVDYLLSHLKQKGGWMEQDEYVVLTPEKIKVDNITEVGGGLYL